MLALLPHALHPQVAELAAGAAALPHVPAGVEVQGVTAPWAAVRPPGSLSLRPGAAKRWCGIARVPGTRRDTKQAQARPQHTLTSRRRRAAPGCREQCGCGYMSNMFPTFVRGPQPWQSHPHSTSSLRAARAGRLFLCPVPCAYRVCAAPIHLGERAAGQGGSHIALPVAAIISVSTNM